MERKQIKAELFIGDYNRIALRCAARNVFVEADYIGKLLTGKRKGIRGKALIIFEESEKVALENIQLKNPNILTNE